MPKPTLENFASILDKEKMQPLFDAVWGALKAPNADAVAKTPAEGRAALDVYSKAEIGAMLEASLGEAALLDVGTTSGTVAAGDAPVAAAAAEVADHESTFAHADLPTASQKAALNAAPTLSGANPVATIADLPADELTADELAAINGANAPDVGNVFATMDDLPANPVQSTDATTIAVVSALPGTPDANTLYFVTA